MGKRLKDLHAEWMNDPEYAEAYAASAVEFEVARALIAAREQSGLTQEEIAARMGTSQSAVSRMESGRARPSLASLDAFARAIGARLRIELEVAG